MTDREAVADSLGCYLDAIAALRLEKLMRGDVLPVEGERVDLVLMATIARGWDAGRVAA